MYFISAGSVIERARKEQPRLPRKKLIQGICTEQTLYALETDQCETDILLTDILLQRLGKSPDKLEIVLSREAYRLVRLRDLIEETILRGRRELAIAVLASYPTQNSVNQMYQKRMQACLSYRIDRDYTQTADLLQQAILLTLPGFSYETIETYLISTMEMENLLALERVRIVTAADSGLQPDPGHLELCMDHIDRNFTDEEEHAKICAKCTWLLAQIYLKQNQATRAMIVCEKGISELRNHTMIYFMLPLLELMAEIGSQIGIAAEQNKYVKYMETLRFLWDSYAKKWYPTDMLFHNCCQKEYHLDYELVKSERTAKHIKQEDLSDGVYKNASSFSNFENAKVSPSKKTFEKLMDKLDIEKGRYNGFVITDSFETMTLRHHLDIALSHNEYAKAENLLEQLRSQLDTTIIENQNTLEDAEILIHRKLHKISTEEAFELQKKLLESLLEAEKKTLRHIPMRNEVLIINRYCGTLLELGLQKDAINMHIQALEKIRRSHISVRYRYRSFSLLLCNYVYECGEKSVAYEELQNELLCGKASVLPRCLIDLLHIWADEGKPEQECLNLSEYIYYISDLYHFLGEKKQYTEFLRSKGITILL